MLYFYFAHKLILRMCVCVRRIKPFFLLGDIQHTLRPCWSSSSIRSYIIEILKLCCGHETTTQTDSSTSWCCKGSRECNEWHANVPYWIRQAQHKRGKQGGKRANAKNRFICSHLAKIRYIKKSSKKRTPRAVFLAHEKAFSHYWVLCFAHEQQYNSSKCAVSKYILGRNNFWVFDWFIHIHTCEWFDCFRGHTVRVQL